LGYLAELSAHSAKAGDIPPISSFPIILGLFSRLSKLPGPVKYMLPSRLFKMPSEATDVLLSGKL
jgi:hypothetical protein